MDASQITKRLQNKTISASFINRLNLNNPPYGMPLGIYDNSILLNVKQGLMSDIRKCNGSYNIDIGCPCGNVSSNNVSSNNDLNQNLGQTEIPVMNNRGISQWSTYFQNSNGNTYGYSVTTDKNNNIYITGQYTSSVAVKLTNKGGADSGKTLPATPILGNSNTFLIKYNSDGVVQWVTTINTDVIVGTSITTDQSNNVYISGYYSSTSEIILQNANGVEDPNKKLPISPVISGDAYNNVFLIKYTSAGNVEWATAINSGIDINMLSIITDKANSVYITGKYISTTNITLNNADGTVTNPPIQLETTTQTDIFLIKYNNSGVVQWAKRIDANNTNDLYITSSITTDQSNNVYLVSLENNKTDTILRKYASNGNSDWTVTINNLTNNSGGIGITSDKDNNIYITGQYHFASSSPDIILKNSDGNNSSSVLAYRPQNTGYLIKYNSNGEVQWAAPTTKTGTYNLGSSPAASNSSGVRSVVTDSLNNVYIVGTYRSQTAITVAHATSSLTSNYTLPLTATSNNLGEISDAIFLIKYNSQGIVNWSTFLDSTYNDYNNYGYDIAVDTLNNVYITGSYKTAQTSNIFLQNANGNGQSGVETYPLPGNNLDSLFLIKYS